MSWGVLGQEGGSGQGALQGSGWIDTGGASRDKGLSSQILRQSHGGQTAVLPASCGEQGCH